MKKSIYILALVLLSTVSFSNNSINKNNNTITVELETENIKQNIEFHFNSTTELENFNFETLPNLLPSAPGCTVDIRVKVSVGVGSTYAEAEITVKGVPCADARKKLVELKEMMQEALS